MAAQYHTIDLDRLALAHGQGCRLEPDLSPGAIEIGGAEYELDRDPVAARVDVSRTATGYALRLRFGGDVAGTCVRCLGPARIAVEVDAREVEQEGASDEDLRSPYVVDGELDLARWARDALALTLPEQPLCRPECRGLCPVCGISLNEVEPGTHGHEPEPDPRWAKLRELRLE